MKFNEKLYAFRKESKLSQEQLADMLEVSRQSVSKWESGQTYPEMDKLLSLCKIFKCTLDSLTNDEIENLSTNIKNKITIDSIVIEITKVIRKSKDMIKSMTKKQITVFSFEIILIFILVLFIKLPFNYLYELGSNIFYSFGNNILSTLLCNIFKFILEISYIIFAVMSFGYIYKIRYLDSFNKKQENNENIQESREIKEKNAEIEIKNTKTAKIFIQNNDTNTFNLFTILGSIFIAIIKFIVIIFEFLFILMLLSLFIFLGIFIVLIFKGIIFFGIILTLLSSILLCIIIAQILFNFIFDKKTNIKTFFISLIIGIAGFGIGFGLTFMDITNIKYINTIPDSFKSTIISQEYEMQDDLMLYGNNFNFVIDESLNNTIKITNEFYKDYINPSIAKDNNIIYLYNSNNSPFASSLIFSYFVDNLKENTIYNYPILFESKIIVQATSDNIRKLQNNYNNYTENKRQDSYNTMIENYNNRIYELEDEINRLNLELQNVNIY